MVDPVKVSIIIPVKPGGEVRALARLHDVDYSSEHWEVLVAEGCAPSRQRNEAAAQASGDILYFLDDDSQVSPGFLRRAVSHYADPKVASVGGPSLTPETDTILQQAFGMTFSSALGGGGMRNRYRRTGEVRSTSDQELILCNLSFRREVFLGNGGFDERLYPNEENELMERVRRAGGLLIHDPDLAVFRSQRPTLKAFCRQLFTYGRGRGEQTVISGLVKPITLIPSLFLLYLLLTPFVNKPVYYLPLLCYLIIGIAFAASEALRGGRLQAVLLLPAIFLLFHICYGAGVVRGLVLPRFRQRAATPCGVAIRRVKGFDQPLKQG